MKAESDFEYRKALGARILSEANDLKRTRQAMAVELGVEPALVDSVINGQASLEEALDLVRSMAAHYPISLSNLWLEADDTDDGAVIMRAADSVATARVFDRKNATGELTPYYEYRDTAMTRIGPFKPEWISDLRFVDDADPDNPDVAYNNGHLMHQQTFFVGEVNFYWSLDGKNHCAEMNTGDSNYITPFVPHSFTSRNPNKPGLIIAVTFGGETRRALDEFSRLDGNSSETLAGDLRDRAAAYGARLARRLATDSMSPSDLTDRLVGSGHDAARATQLAKGALPGSHDETVSIAAALGVRAEDLMVTALEPGHEVVLQYADESMPRPLLSNNAVNCHLRELARTKHLPDMKGFSVDVVGAADDAPPFQHHLFEYVFNYGDAPVALLWGENREAVLRSGDSVCFRPMVKHQFARLEDEGTGRLCVVRVPGALTDSGLDEYARFPSDGRRRVSGETKQWF
jgi:hypothetical protein